jgi:hypothetical protein
MAIVPEGRDGAVAAEVIQRCDPVTGTACHEVVDRLAAADRARLIDVDHPAVGELRRQASWWAERHGRGTVPDEEPTT